MTPDINDFRAVITLVSLLAFLGIVAWAYSARRKRGFDEAAHSVLDETDEQGGQASVRGGKK